MAMKGNSHSPNLQGWRLAIRLFMILVGGGGCCNILICRCMQKHIQHNKGKRTQFFRKIYLSLYSKGFERVTKGFMWERWVGDWTELQHIDPPQLFWLQQHFFPVLLGCSTEGLGARPLLGRGFHFSIFSPTNWLPVAPGLYNYLRPPTSCGVTIRTQFNPSTVKVIPRYLRPDAPVIYTGAFLMWQPGRVGGQYVTLLPLCRDAVDVFYIPSWLGWNIFIVLFRYYFLIMYLKKNKTITFLIAIKISLDYARVVIRSQESVTLALL